MDGGELGGGRGLSDVISCGFLRIASEFWTAGELGGGRETVGCDQLWVSRCEF